MINDIAFIYQIERFTVSLRAALIVRKKSSCVSFQDDLCFSSFEYLFFSCRGRNSARSVPCILCLAESNGFRFFAAARSHIFACFSKDRGMNVRVQIAQGNNTSAASPSIYSNIFLQSDSPRIGSFNENLLVNYRRIFFS